jgi:hypothetical protein
VPDNEQVIWFSETSETFLRKKRYVGGVYCNFLEESDKMKILLLLLQHFLKKKVKRETQLSMYQV